MTTMTDATTRVTAGVDTHRDQHMVATLDERGAELGVRSFATTPAGYREAIAAARASTRASCARALQTRSIVNSVNPRVSTFSAS